MHSSESFFRLDCGLERGVFRGLLCLRKRFPHARALPDEGLQFEDGSEESDDSGLGNCL